LWQYCGSKSKETPNDSPRRLSRRVGRRDAAVPLQSSGRGSKSSMRVSLLYVSLKLAFFTFYLCRKSASCTHVSAVLHALVALTTTGFQLQPALPSTSLPDEEDAIMPVTSYLCQWKVPKKRKESNLPMSATVFEKHDYHEQKKSTLQFCTYPAAHSQVGKHDNYRAS